MCFTWLSWVCWIWRRKVSAAATNKVVFTLAEGDHCVSSLCLPFIHFPSLVSSFSLPFSPSPFSYPCYLLCQFCPLWFDLMKCQCCWRCQCCCRASMSKGTAHQAVLQPIGLTSKGAPFNLARSIVPTVTTVRLSIAIKIGDGNCDVWPPKSTQKDGPAKQQQQQLLTPQTC